MRETKYVAKKGFEDFYELAVAKKEQFDSELTLAKEKAIAEVENAFASKKVAIDEILNKVSEIVEVEIADETPLQENPQCVFENDEIEENQGY